MNDTQHKMWYTIAVNVHKHAYRVNKRTKANVELVAVGVVLNRITENNIGAVVEGKRIFL